MIPLHRIITALVKLFMLVTAALSIPHARGDVLHPTKVEIAAATQISTTASPVSLRDAIIWTPSPIQGISR